MRRKLVPLGIHLGGNLIGGAALGVTVGWLGGLPGLSGPSMVASVAALICAAYALNGLRLARFPQPSTGMQVPISWRRLPAPAMALLYGAPLGAGVFTRIFDGTLYVLLAGAVLTGDALMGAVILGAFGFARGAFVLLVAALGLHDREDVTSIVEGRRRGSVGLGCGSRCC